jgi:hypothetical protein
VSSPSKKAGTWWETQVVNYLRPYWPKINRRALRGRFDGGDTQDGPADCSLECKNEARIELPRYLRQAKAAAARNGHRYYAAIVRNRRGKFSSGSVSEAFAVMPLALWADVMRRLEDAA